MKSWKLIVAVIVLVAWHASGTSSLGGETAKLMTIEPPPAGKLYHGVFPNGKLKEGERENLGEDAVTPEGLDEYEKECGKQVAWVILPNEWSKSDCFPSDTAEWIRARGAVPYIRLLLRSSEKARNQYGREKYTLQAIIDGQFDEPLKRWARAARDFGYPLLVSYGPECNGEWFAWNGKWNGAGQLCCYGDPNRPDGPERFVDAYRHIVSTMRREGAHNITWVFHVSNEDNPNVDWNRMENYYPGDKFVDWLGVSVYGPQKPADEYGESFPTLMNCAYCRLANLAYKPVIVAEFGCTAFNEQFDPAAWAKEALTDIFLHKWPRVIGFSWWNERWINEWENPDNDTTMRLQDIPALSDVFKTQLSRNASELVTRPIIRNLSEKITKHGRPCGRSRREGRSRSRRVR